MCEQFYHAYNFIPLGKNGPQRAKRETGSLTGKITCTLTPVTDLFVPDSRPRTYGGTKNVGEKVLDFFSYCSDADVNSNHPMTEDSAPQEPVIPGSELRGMVRSMYEAVTDSCMSSLNPDKELSARSIMPKYPALLEYSGGKWSLYQADYYDLDYGPKQVRENRRTHEQIVIPMGLFYKGNPNGLGYFTKDYRTGRYSLTLKNNPAKRYYANAPFTIRADGRKVVEIVAGFDAYDEDEDEYYTDHGYLFIGEDISQKRKHFIFTECYDAKKQTYVTVTDDETSIRKAVFGYNKILREYYQNQKVNKQKDAFTKDIHPKPLMYVDSLIPDTPKDGSVFCVWYDVVGEHLYLSPAQIGRDIFYHDLPKFAGKYSPCMKKDNLCEACSLFGIAGKDSDSLGGRVRFADARFIGTNAEYQEITTLKELSNPKITCMEMYTRRKGAAANAQFWTYDFYYDEATGAYQSISENDLELNGRKMYYHHPNCNGTAYYSYDWDSQNLTQVQREGAKKRLVTVRPLKAGECNQFRFDVFFEHLTETELKKLVTVLGLFGDARFAYKLGMGKPLGLGSVKVRVDAVLLRKMEMNGAQNPFSFAADADYQPLPWMPLEQRTKMFGKGVSWNELEAMLDINHTGQKQVSYPIAENSSNGYAWFTNNRKLSRPPRITQTLQTQGPNAGILKTNTKRK